MVTRKFAADDGNLNIGGVVTSRQRKYIDIDLEFEASEDTGDIFKKKDANAVKTAIKHLILTENGERPYQYAFGSNVAGLLFELMDDVTSIEIKESIRKAIQNFEPRARIINIIVNAIPERNSVEATLEFLVVTTQQQVTLTLTLDRLR